MTGFLPSLLIVAALSVVETPIPAEWTLEDALKQWPPMTKAMQHVGIPGCQWQTGVYWDGALIIGQPLHRVQYVHPRLAEEVALAGLGDNMLHLSIGFGEPMRLVDRAGSNAPAIRKGLQEGRLPIPYVETTDGDLVWRETVFAHLLDRDMEDGMHPRPEDLPVVQVRFQVHNTGPARNTGHLWLHFGEISQASRYFLSGSELAPALPHRFEPPYGFIGDRVRYVLPPPSNGELVWHDQAPARRVIEWKVPLAAGEGAQLRLILPYGAVDRDRAQRLLSTDYAQCRAEVVDYWRRLAYGPGQIVTPDPFINDYLVAAVGQMAQQVCYRHKAKLWMFKTSPNWYEDYYAANAAAALPTLDLRGLSSHSEKVLSSFVDFQSDDAGGLLVNRGGGPMGGLSGKSGLAGEGFARRPGFLGNFGPPVSAVPLGDPRQGWTANMSLMGHGAELYALAAHYRITRDRAWLGRGPGSPLEAMLAGCDWIAFQRRRSMREEDGHKVPHWGLLPPASAHDWLSGSTIFNDAWCIAGMAETVRLLREIGHPRAEELAQELHDYRQCLHDRYAEARDRARPLPLPDGTSIPFVPRMVSELDWKTLDWTYTSYGPIRAAGLGALDPHDPLVDQALAFLAAGVPRASDPARRTFFWTHYVQHEPPWPMYEAFLCRDELAPFFELAFNNLAAGVHRDFRVDCETRDGVPSCAPGDAERWRMFRNMFVHEMGGEDGGPQELFLMQAIPRAWLRPGDRLAIVDMGTLFGGKVDLEARVTNEGNRLEVDVNLRRLAVQPAAARMRMRSGDGCPLTAVEVNGRPAKVLDGDTVHLPTTTHGRFHVIACFAK